MELQTQIEILKTQLTEEKKMHKAYKDFFTSAVEQICKLDFELEALKKVMNDFIKNN